MKNIHALVVLLLLALAAPLAIHYRAWPQGNHAATPTQLEPTLSPQQQTSSVESPPANADSNARPTFNSGLTNGSLTLPGASSSLPLLSIIGFGVFVGGLISAFRTRAAHK